MRDRALFQIEQRLSKRESKCIAILIGESSMICDVVSFQTEHGYIEVALEDGAITMVDTDAIAAISLEPESEG